MNIVDVSLTFELPRKMAKIYKKCFFLNLNISTLVLRSVKQTFRRSPKLITFTISQ